MYNKMIKRLIAALTIGALMAFAVATPASAAVGACHQDAVCFYDTGSSSAFIDHDDADTYLGQCWTMAPSHRNIASYIRNWTDHQWTVYTGPWCTGTAGPLYAETSGWMSGIYDDNIESYKRVG